MAITPEKADELVKLAKQLPVEVLETFNELIVHNMRGGGAKVLQNEAVRAICNRMKIRQDDVYDRGYLEVDAAFKEAGWKVVYDKPAMDEDYDASFTFSKK